MATATPPSPFERIFSRRDLFRGPSGWAFLWGAFAAILLFLWLLTFYLLVDLAQFFGTFDTSLDSVEKIEFAERLGVLEIQRADGEDSATPESGELPPYGEVNRKIWRATDTGILPTVWRSHGTAWGPTMLALYRGVTPLRKDEGAFITLILTLIVVSLLRTFALSRHEKARYNAGLELATRYRQRLHRQALRLGPSDLDPDGHRDVFQLFTDGVQRVQNGVSHWVDVLSRAPVELLLLVVFALLLDPRMAFQCIVPLLACAFLVEKAINRAEDKRNLAATKADHELKLLAERFQKTRLVRGYRMEEAEHQRFQTQLSRYASEIAQGVRQTGWSAWVSRLLVTCCMGLVLFLILNRIRVEPFQFSLSVALSLLVTFAAMGPALHRLWRLSQARAETSEAVSRVQRYLDRIPDVSQAVGAKFLQPLSGQVQFESVSYSPPGSPRRVLDRLDLTIPAGQTTAIVSMDPLEPKTLVSLLPRYLEPKTGRILFDGEDINWATLESLRTECLLIDAEDSFFTGTVLENLTCGDDSFSFNQVTTATKEVHAHQFISRLPQGYETVLGEHGEQLEPGELFRLSLARAALRDPAFLIIEEPNVPFDDATKGLLDDSYNRILPGRTAIFLPARLSTLKRVDQIVMMHQGRAYAMAPHAKLVQQLPLYRHWEYMKFNEFRSLGSESA